MHTIYAIPCDMEAFSSVNCVLLIIRVYLVNVALTVLMEDRAPQVTMGLLEKQDQEEHLV